MVDEAVQRVAHVIGRRSAFVRRASHEGDRAEADVLAANIDVVFLVHALTAPPNQRRLERELVLAFDSGAQPQIVLTKSDVADDIEATVDELRAVAAGVPVHIASGITGVGLEPIRAPPKGSHTCVLRCLWSWQVDARELADWTPRDGNLRGTRARSAWSAHDGGDTITPAR